MHPTAAAIEPTENHDGMADGLDAVSESAIGISMRTCLPASITCAACAACICVGVVRIAASTSGKASASARSPV